MIIKPELLETSSGKIYTIKKLPENYDGLNMVVFVQSFAEEANKSRHMFSLIATKLADKGIGSILFDYYGTGESFGSFEDATLTTYTEDLRYIISKVKKESCNVTLVGLRVGGLVALNLGESLKEIDHLVLVNPVVNGKQFMGQFFRMRTAASLTGGPKVTSKDIKQELSENGYTEISGYSLNQTLVEQFETTNIDSQTSVMQSNIGRISWVEINNSIEKKITPVVSKAMDIVKKQCQQFYTTVVTGDAFWSTQEITIVPGFITELENLLIQKADDGI